MRHWTALFLAALCVLALGAVPAALAAQDAEESQRGDAERAGTETAANDPLGRDTPLDSMRGFASAAEAFDWEAAARFLDLRNLPPDVRRVPGATLAEQLYFILQRREVTIDSQQLSDRPEGHLLEDLPDYRDQLTEVVTREGPVPLLLQRVPTAEGDFIWKISNATVRRIPALYEEFSYPPWVEAIRDAVPGDRSFLGLELFKWLIVIGAVVVLLPVLLALAYGLAWLAFRSSPAWPEFRALFLGPVTGLALALALRELIYELGVGVQAYRIMQANTLFTAFSVWFVWKAANIWRARRRHRYEQEGRSDAAVLGRPIANAVKLVSLILGLLIWLANAGVDITALLTGLGIGGIAVALALQKPIEDLFGAVSIYSQQPVSTGDLCRYGDSVGRVEEIGLRTTRIRTLSNSLVNVPNAQLSTGIIENLTARTKIRYQPDLPLRYDTTRDQLETVLAGLERMLVENPRVEDDTIRVRLREFSPNAIIVRIRAFALTRDFEEYLEIVQEINLAIMRVLDDHGVRFSQGAQTLFIEAGHADDLAPGPA